MTNKFLRNYRLEIDVTETKTTVLVPPLDMAFNCNKAIGTGTGGLNELTIRIKNLTESLRNRLVKDRADKKKQIALRLFAGYANDIKLITACTLFEGSNMRSGSDIETSLVCLDGGIDLQTSNTSATVRTKKQSYETLSENMTRVTKGKVTEQAEVLRPIVLVGNTIQLAKKGIRPDEDFFIDNEQYYILKKDEVRPGQVPLVSPATGLLNTPKKSSNLIIFTMLIDPSVKMGGSIKLESDLNKELNGTYKVQAINYTGQYEGGTWQQEITVSGL